MRAVKVTDLNDYRAAVERAHLVPPRTEGGLPRAARASELPDPPPIAWLIDQVWPAGEFGLIVGDGGAFKSSVAIHMACAVAGGHRLFDEFQCLPRPALIVSAEDHRDVVLMRARAFCAGHGWGRATLENLYILADGSPTLADRPWTEHLAAEIERIRPGLIVLDPWAELMGGDENSNTDARTAIKYIRHVAGKVGAAVVLVHHAGKMKEGGRSLDRIRGASALPSAARVVWFFDFTENGLQIENLKHSRAPRLAPFALERDIVTPPDNRAAWLSARITRKTVEDALERNILAQLSAAPNGERSFNDLAELLNVRKQNLRYTLDRMVAAGRLERREGARRSQWYARKTTGSDWFPPSGTSGDDGAAPHAPGAASDSGLVPGVTHPLKGVVHGNQSSATGASAQEPVAEDEDPHGLWEPVHQSGTSQRTSQEPVDAPVDAHETPMTEDDILTRLEERRGLGDE